MTYDQLLDAIEEAQRRRRALSDHEEDRPAGERRRSAAGNRYSVDPDPSLMDQWDAKRRALQAELDEEIG
jgi:hypothetical protein